MAINSQTTERLKTNPKINSQTVFTVTASTSTANALLNNMRIKDSYLCHDGGRFYGVLVTKDDIRETQRFTTKQEAEDVLHVWMEAERTH